MRRARRLVRNDGFTATVRVHGTTSYVADRGGRTPRVRRVLRYGQVWRSHGFRCTSRRAGITYRHGPGPGIG